MTAESDRYASRQDLQALADAHKQHVDQIRAVAAGHALLTDQMADITVTLKRQDAIIATNSSQLAKIVASVGENTELTRDIKDALAAGRFSVRAAKWLAGAAITGSASWLAIKDFFRP